MLAQDLRRGHTFMYNGTEVTVARVNTVMKSNCTEVENVTAVGGRLYRFYPDACLTLVAPKVGERVEVHGPDLSESGEVITSLSPYPGRVLVRRDLGGFIGAGIDIVTRIIEDEEADL